MMTKRGRPAIYDWDEWSNGLPHRLVHGEDFKCSPRALVVLAHREAKKRGLIARTKLAHDNKTLTMIFINPDFS